ncbi:hypothetical protein Nepgr_028031 [Nepenthes gracilis]|uniref:Nucleolar protein 14 n=1 Tax=Nepenthes gracilis TaxID=150966 RepID=A0AAD3Y210_NEPGR|nr:hypothetical protein Nepgr_028031 [Nepenthes gracilis]
MVKKAISGKSDTKKKKKGVKKAGPNAVWKKLKPQKENPFETIWSRRKFDILGKKCKGEERRIGLARSLAIEKRKKTLLKEYEQSGKSSVFLDKRIGEQNDSLGEFDKAILRSQRERQMKFKKKNKYNLSDGEEDEFEVHDGGSFPERDDFDEEVIPDDDDVDQADYKKTPPILKQLNTLAPGEPLTTGLTEEEQNRPKNKKEVMKEIMLKSKFFKVQKASEKEENELLVEQLDKDFTSSLQSQALLSLTRPDKINAVKALANQSIPKELIKKDHTSVQKSDFSKQGPPDSYDKLVTEMALEIRARPSDRTKTSEEIAEEERERLELLEQERQKRMLAPDGTSDDDNASEDAEGTSTQISRPVSGDDLGDSFSPGGKPRIKKGWVDEILERNANDSDDEDGTCSDDSEDDKADEEGTEEENGENDEKGEIFEDWEQSDDDLGMDFRGIEDRENEGQLGEMEHKFNEMADASQTIKRRRTDLIDSEKTRADGELHSTQPADLPFKIDAPSSMEELCSLLENRSIKDIEVAIWRIRCCNPIKENRKKMQVFYGLLLQFFATLANKKPLNFELLNLLFKPLMEMSCEIPYFSAICARERLLQTQKRFCEVVKDSENSSWPTLKTLFLLRLWSMIFPCSDFRHPVMTPAVLLMCEYLMRCPILCGRDMAVGSFLCSMVLLVTNQTHKFCPEALTFLKALLMAAIHRDSRSCQETEFYHILEFKVPRSLLCIQEHVDEIIPLDFLEIMNLPEDSSFFSSDSFRASMLVSLVETLKGFVDVYGELRAFPEIFLPISRLLLEVAEQPNLPSLLQDELRCLAQLITKKADEHHKPRRPLQFRKQKPVPIKLLNPKFEENFVKGRDYDPDRERSECRKLNKLLKREAKGAARELRKDNRFLFDVKERERVQLEEERAENLERGGRGGDELGFLGQQEVHRSAPQRQ